MRTSKLFTAGGVVMFPLLAFSVVAMLRKERSSLRDVTRMTIALIIERVRFWYCVNSCQSRVMPEVLNLYRLENAVSALDKLQRGCRFTYKFTFIGDITAIATQKQ